MSAVSQSVFRGGLTATHISVNGGFIDAFDSSIEGVASGQARPDHAEKG